jgi:hypothetical protein
MTKRAINWNASKKRGEPSTSATVSTSGKAYGTINQTEAGKWEAWAPGPMVDRGGVMMRSLEIVGTYSTVTEAADALVERAA